MKINDAAGGREEIEEVRFDKDAERGENAKSCGMGKLEFTDGSKIRSGAGMKDNIGALGKNFKCGVGEWAIAKEDNLWARV